MRRRPRRSNLAAAVAAVLLAPAAHAVSLNPDGLGQALIYPYYTVRSVGGNAFHTYLTVGNSASDAKALRVRLREGRNGREVLSFNLYLGPNDMWAGALVPTADGARLLTTDASCTDPVFVNGAIDLRHEAFSGAQADGFGDTLDRTREGYVEIFEMATLFSESAASVEHNAAGVPNDCAFIRGPTLPLVARPTGGLWGTLTLINVNGGQDFTLDATALADLASRAYFRPASDPYPDFTAAEIDPVSSVLKRGHDPSRPQLPRFENANFLYRSTWTRPVDAVSAVLMSSAWLGEYVLDAETVSATDLVVTMPTRHHYVTATGATSPFQSPSQWSPSCETSPGARLGDTIHRIAFNRETQEVTHGSCYLGSSFGIPCPGNTASICASSAVATLVTQERFPPENAASYVIGSTTKGLARGDWQLVAAASGGWTALATTSVNAAMAGLTSLPGSMRINLDTGQVLTGAHTFFGLPVVAFFARTFNNGQLACAGASCQGTYGSAFPMRSIRYVKP